MPRLSYRVKLFLAFSAVAAAGVAAVAYLTVRPLVRETNARIERGLISQARLTAELLGHSDLTRETLDDEADRLGQFVDARVTLVAADGTVLGDSAEDGAALEALENHGERPEVLVARATGLGTFRRYSTTVNTELLYVAVPAQHPSVAVVRLALPLTEIQSQVRAVRRATAVALVVALTIAVALAWLASMLLSRRLQALASAAHRYASGQFARDTHEDDDIGRLGRVLDESMRTLTMRMAELDLARGRLEAILAGMTEGVIVVDGEGRMQLVNGTARQMLGVGEITGEPYLHAIRHPGVVAQFDAAMAGTPPDAVDIALPGGRVVQARGVPMAHGGAIVVLHDITRLREADQIRRDFVANVSHELRTPLTAIRGYAEALRDESLPAVNRAAFLDTITRNTQRMERLVRDLLRLARLEAGQELGERAPMAVTDVVERVVADLKPRVDARRQRIDVAIAPDADDIVSDAAKLEEVLKNLVENAINYAPEATRIGIEASRRDGRFEIAVFDEGPGIPSADLTRVFERFYRVDKARSRESGGTGLGLSIVKHLVERLGGRVIAGNRPEGGARFTVVLPAEETHI